MKECDQERFYREYSAALKEAKKNHKPCPECNSPLIQMRYIEPPDCDCPKCQARELEGKPDKLY